MTPILNSLQKLRGHCEDGVTSRVRVVVDHCSETVFYEHSREIALSIGTYKHSAVVKEWLRSVKDNQIQFQHWKGRWGRVPALAKELFIGNWYFWETLFSKCAPSCGLTTC